MNNLIAHIKTSNETWDSRVDKLKIEYLDT
jgi:hypothetical protein